MTFGTRTAWFIFDTGAGTHTFARWFVDEARVPLDDRAGPGVAVRDSAGAALSVRRVGRLTGRLPDRATVRVEGGIVAAFPPFFASSDIGGLINPQLLAREDRAVVLDLRIPELRFERFEDAVHRLGARLLRSDELQLCREKHAPVPNLLYAIRVKAEDAEGWLQIDSGAGRTSIVSQSRLVQGRRLEPGGSMMGVAGESKPYSVARDLTLRFADESATINAHVVESTHGGKCGSDGLLGRDVLDRCALVLGPASVAIACR